MRVPVILIREGRGNENDGRYYGADCLRRAVEQRRFEGVPSYIDHAKPGTPASKRILAGHVRDVMLREIDGKAAICATLHACGDRARNLLRTAQQVEDYFGDRKHQPYIGLSIAAKGIGGTTTLREGVRVDEISEVESVDLVDRAGCGGGLDLGRSGLVLREAASLKFRTTTFAAIPTQTEPTMTFTFEDPEPRFRYAGEPLRERGSVETRGGVPSGMTFSFDDEPRAPTFFPADPIRGESLREQDRTAIPAGMTFDFGAPEKMTFTFGRTEI